MLNAKENGSNQIRVNIPRSFSDRTFQFEMRTASGIHGCVCFFLKKKKESQLTFHKTKRKFFFSFSMQILFANKCV